MIEIQTNESNGMTFQRAIVDSVEEALGYLLPRIRRQSKAFYEKEIRREMEEDGETVVDKHAGGGMYLSAKMREL